MRNTIEQLLAASGHDAYFGEPVTQLEHACQCAHLAEQAGADDETVVAAFLHDIGHLLDVGELTPELANRHMDGYGTVDHEKTGADFLRELGFSEKVAQLAENHVKAKRYLVYKQPGYVARLSAASLKTLAFQGGPMKPGEALAFETNPYFRGILQLRAWDEQAKTPGLPTPDPGHYLAMVEAVLAR